MPFRGTVIDLAVEEVDVLARSGDAPVQFSAIFAKHHRETGS